MEHCNPQQREEMLQKILPELLTTAFDMYGTQSLQKMMPFLTERQVTSYYRCISAQYPQLDRLGSFIFARKCHFIDKTQQGQLPYTILPGSSSTQTQSVDIRFCKR